MKNVFLGAACAVLLAATPASAQGFMPFGVKLDIYGGAGFGSAGVKDFKTKSGAFGEAGANLRLPFAGGWDVLFGAAVQTGQTIKVSTPYSFTIPQRPPLAPLTFSGTEVERFQFGTALIGKVGLGYTTGPWRFGVNGLVKNQSVSYRYTDTVAAFGPIPGSTFSFKKSRQLTRFGAELTARYSLDSGVFIELAGGAFAGGTVKIDGAKAKVQPEGFISARLGYTF